MVPSILQEEYQSVYLFDVIPWFQEVSSFPRDTLFFKFHFHLHLFDGVSF